MRHAGVGFPIQRIGATEYLRELSGEYWSSRFEGFIPWTFALLDDQSKIKTTNSSTLDNMEVRVEM